MIEIQCHFTGVLCPTIAFVLFAQFVMIMEIYKTSQSIFESCFGLYSLVKYNIVMNFCGKLLNKAFKLFHFRQPLHINVWIVLLQGLMYFLQRLIPFVCLLAHKIPRVFVQKRHSFLVTKLGLSPDDSYSTSGSTFFTVINDNVNALVRDASIVLKLHYYNIKKIR